MNKDTWVIVPVYNEAPVIKGVLKGLLKKFSQVVVVVDGSTDGTYEEVRKTGVHIVRHPINLGQGAALQTGVEFALAQPGASYFVTYDGDGQHRVDDAERMVRVLKKSKVDIVLGARFLGDTSPPLWKTIVLKTAIYWRNVFSSIKLTDTHNGLRAFNRKVAEGLKLTLPGMSYASELQNRIVSHKFSYQEVPVTIDYTDYSKAKGQPWINSVNIAFDMLIMRLTKK